MLRAQNWVRWLVGLAIFLFVGGMSWISVLIYRIRDYPDAIKYEVHMPWTPRLMVFVGFCPLVIVAARTGMYGPRSRKFTGRRR